MGQADTDLGKTLPQEALPFRASLPPSLEDLVRRERPPFLHQARRHADGLHRRQRFFGHRLDANSPIGQRTSECVSWTCLPWPTSIVAITPPIAGHCIHRPARLLKGAVLIGPC
jgi:hypothetical protein